MEPIDLHRAAFGSDTTVSRLAVGAAVALFSVAGGYVLVTERTSFATATEFLYLLVLGAVVVAVASAYHDGGFVVSWILALAPVCGTLGAYALVMRQEGPSPVALPGSFYGHGAPSFWLPVALLFGTLAFGGGVLARWAASGLRSD